MFTLTNISVILFTTTVINAMAMLIAWQRHRTKGGLYFAAGMTGITLWTLAAALDYSAVAIPLKVFFAKIEYTGYNIAFAYLTLFAFSYAGYDDWLEKAWVQSLFVIVPALNILLPWTNDWHGWLWTGFTRSDTGENTVIFEHGPAYVFAVMTGYLMLISIVVLLWQSSQKGSELARRQARLLFFASLMPIIGNLTYLLQSPNLKGIDWSSVSVSVSGILFLLALYGTRFLDIVPIARNEMIERMRDSVLVLDARDRLIDFNAAAQMNFGISHDKLGAPIQHVMPEWGTIESVPLHDGNVRLGIAVSYETGTGIYDVHTTNLADHRGQLYGRLLVFIEASKRVQTEQVLRASETLFRQMFTEHSAIKLLLEPVSGKIMDANPAAARFYGYSRETLVQMDLSQITTMSPAEVDVSLKAARQHERNYFNAQHRLASGALREVEIYSTPIQVNDRQFLYSIIHDITERKQIQDKLETSQQLAEGLYESAPDALITVNSKGRITRMNSRAHSLFGYTGEELIGQPIEVLIPASFHEQHRQHRQNYFVHPNLRPMGAGLQLRAIHKDGRQFPVEIGLSPLQVNGETFVTADIRDDTERHQMEASLRQRNDVLAVLNQTMLNLINRHKVDEILQALLPVIADLLHAPQVSIDLIEPEDVLVTYAATANQPLQVGDRMHRGQGGFLSWQAIDSGQPTVLDDYSAWQKRRTLYEGFPIHAIAIIPIRQREHMIGAINFSRNIPDQPFSETDISVAQQLAQMVALVLDNAQLYAQLQSELSERKQIEESLRESRENFQRYFNMSTVGMCVTSPDMHWIETNGRLRQMLGYTTEELDQLTWKDLTHPDDLDVDLSLFQQLLTNGRDSYELDKRFIRKDGDVVYAAMYVSCIRNADGNIRYILASLVDITERKRAEAALFTLAAVEERQRLARDLHDSVNQSIHSLVLFSQTLTSALERNNTDRARQLAGRLEESARQALKETRLLLYEIQTPAEGRGVDLIEELNARLANVELRAGLRAQVIQEGPPECWPQSWSENLFWIAIEALNNSLKHAQARSVKIILRTSSDSLELEVRDDGRGFDTTQPSSGGYGLRTMQERAALLGGQITLTSIPKKGTRVLFHAGIKDSSTWIKSEFSS